jgi:hypothetical protein
VPPLPATRQPPQQDARREGQEHPRVWLQARTEPRLAKPEVRRHHVHDVRELNTLPHMRMVVQDDHATKTAYAGLGEKKRKSHLNAEGHWNGDMPFLRRVSKNGSRWGAIAPYLHTEMGESAIGEVMEDWNERLDLRPGERLVSSMGRKTYCTFGDKCAAAIQC